MRAVRRSATAAAHRDLEHSLRPNSGSAQYGNIGPRRRSTMSLTIGEVHTGLLMTAVAASVETATDLLAILPGGSVGIRRRPVRYCWSPEVLTGVDCLAPL